MLVLQTYDADLDDADGFCVGSIHKYGLQYSPIPATIVQPGMRLVKGAAIRLKREHASGTIAVASST